MQNCLVYHYLSNFLPIGLAGAVNKAEEEEDRPNLCINYLTRYNAVYRTAPVTPVEKEIMNSDVMI